MAARRIVARGVGVLNVALQILFGVGLVSVLLGLASCRWMFGVDIGRFTIGFNEGRLCATMWSGTVGPGYYGMRKHALAVNWHYSADRIDNSTETICRTAYIPLWVPFLAGALPAEACWAFVAIRRRSLARADRCLGCGYDRAGLPSGAVCPECGMAVTPLSAS
jgi:hypothetical protein